MKQLFAALCLAVLSVASATASDTRDPSSHFFHESFGDFSEELELARDEGKSGVVIFFEMDDCPFCHWMKQHVLNQREVQDYFREHFQVYVVDVDGGIEVVDFDGRSMSQQDFAFREHRVRATPVTIFFDLEGNAVHRFTGRTADADEFLLMGHFVKEGIYKEMRFARYKREQQE